MILGPGLTHHARGGVDPTRNKNTHKGSTIKYSVGNNHGEPESSSELVITNWEPAALGLLF